MTLGPEATARAPLNLTFLEASVQEASEGILAFDHEFRYLVWNHAMEAISGLKRDQVVGRVAFEVFPFLLEIGEDEYFRAALRGERVRTQARGFNVNGGHSGFFDAVYLPIRDDSGQIVGGVGYVRECSAHLKEQAIRSELDIREKFLSTLLQSAETISAELDLEKVVQHATDAATALAGAQFGAFFYNVENDRGESYMLYTLSGVPREAFSKFPMPRNTAVFGPTFSGEGIVRSGDITKDSRYGKNSPRKGMPEGHLPVRSYLAVPVKSRAGEVFGGMFFGHAETDKFSEMSERMVSAIARQAGIAIENSRLYEAEKRARSRAEESEAKISAIWSSMSDGFVSLDKDWKYRYANDKACELLKITRDDLMGNTIWEMFPEVHGTVFERELRSAAETQSTRHFEDYFVPFKTWFESHIYPSAETVSIYFRDITSEKNAAKEIQKIEDRLKLITTTTDIGTWYCDLPFDVLEWSTKTKEHFWLPADSRVTIDTFYERIHPEDRERTRQAIERSISEKGVYDIDYRTVSPDAQIKWIRAIGRGFYDSEGEPTRFDGVTVDQTARRKSEDTLRRTERLATAGRLAATVAHEVNNPLETVTNLLFLCQTDPEASEQIKSRLKLADEELRRVAHIVRQTLGFYRDTSIRKETNFSRLILDVVDLFKKRFYDKGVSLKTGVGDSIHAFIMPDGIRQVVANFLSNALDACPSGAEVGLAIKENPDQVIFEISDTGSGIKPENLVHLFEPFFTTKSDVGTGLGLWVSNSIVEKHGGKITVRTMTDPQHHGTTFSIALPRAVPNQPKLDS